MTVPVPEDVTPCVVPTILYVEDEVLIRAFVAEGLRDEGFHVVEAANADEARTYLIAGDPVDLVFTDIDMPGSTNGIELTRYILDHLPGLKVILTSGGTKGQDARALGAFLPKPFGLADALVLIRHALVRPVA